MLQTIGKRERERLERAGGGRSACCRRSARERGPRPGSIIKLLPRHHFYHFVPPLIQAHRHRHRNRTNLSKKKGSEERKRGKDSEAITLGEGGREGGREESGAWGSAGVWSVFRSMEYSRVRE